MRRWLLIALTIVPHGLAAGGDDLQAWTSLDTVARLDDAPGWVADAAGSMPCELEIGGSWVPARKPGPAGQLVGYSPQLEATLEQAIAAARRSAARQIRDLVLSAAQKERELRGADPGTLAACAAELVDASLAELEAGRFSQEVLRPYGTLHRSAILVRADARSFARLVDKLERAEHDGRLAAFARRRKLFWVGAAALLLAATVYLVYTLLNAGTKGHFAWPLRIVSALTLGVLYCGLIYLIRGGWTHVP